MEILMQFLLVLLAALTFYTLLLVAMIACFCLWIPVGMLRCEIAKAKGMGFDYCGVNTWCPPKTWC